LPTAQLALAQLYSARRATPKDLVFAYMWFLIASEQITRAKNHVNKSMTMQQLLESEQRAAEWMRNTRKIPPSSIDDSDEPQPRWEKRRNDRLIQLIRPITSPLPLADSFAHIAGDRRCNLRSL